MTTRLLPGSYATGAAARGDGDAAGSSCTHSPSWKLHVSSRVAPCGPHPPNKSTYPFAASYAMLAHARGDGEMRGLLFVQRPEENVHVSSRNVQFEREQSVPPNRTV